MSNAGSLGTGVNEFAFDLDSQKGVTILLASIRASDISTDQKNELRDLVFLYANGGKDQSVRITIEQKVVSYGVTLAETLKPTSVETKTVEKPRPAFGTSRPAPSFAPSFTKTITPTPVSNQVIPTPVKPVSVETVIEKSPEVSAPVVAEIKSEPIPVSAPEVVIPVSIPQPEIIKEEPQPAPVEEVVSEAPVATPQPAEDNYDSAKSLQRIKEIKSLVNDKVGNPVNLVDIDNEVGREYMGALLDAMKKINSGSSAISAMKRLEASFIEVQKTLEKHSKAPADETTAQPVNQESNVETVMEPAPVDLPVLEPVQQSAPEVIAPVSIPQPEIIKEEPQPAPVEAVIKPILEPQPEPVRTSHVPLQDLNLRAKEIIASPEIPKIEETSETAWGESSDTQTESSKPESRIPIARIASLADSKKPQTIDKLPSAESIETSSVTGDNLFTKQVDDGLEQLLQEWAIFKKSGLFGTGPKGREHPLFKKIASLQIPLLLAGRFEGATQEIKQSITDYMNGWRYEQGIIYEQGETFEHYLRRVIRHILDLQKNK